MREDLKKRLLPKLKEPLSPIQSPRGWVSAAVLVPLFRKRQEWHCLLTARSNKVRHHKNQISFPGGVFHHRDQILLTTALRETEEEVGIRSSDVDVWGRLDATPTPTRFLITPYVGTFPYPYSFRPNAEEIEKILEIPIRDFLDAPPMIQTISFLGSTHEIPFYRFGDQWIWGATGRILRQLTALLADSTPHRSMPGDQAQRLTY